jgi:hypothetical protein
VPDFYALTTVPLPKVLHGSDGEYSIGTLSENERLAIEDYFFGKNIKLSIPSTSTAVVFPHNQSEKASSEDFAVLVEFALGILAVSGFQPVGLVAALSATKCQDAIQRSYGEVSPAPVFPKKVTKAAASTWLRHFFAARRKTKDGLHITADRFVRYARMDNTRDAMVDLCICLESLMDSQTEISFRFGVCLAKVRGGADAEELSTLLSDLYDLRSKVVHGADAAKEHKKVEPHALRLRNSSRAILTRYVVYLAEHTRDEWKKHLRKSLFS